MPLSSCRLQRVVSQATPPYGSGIVSCHILSLGGYIGETTDSNTPTKANRPATAGCLMKCGTHLHINANRLTRLHLHNTLRSGKCYGFQFFTTSSGPIDRVTSARIIIHIQLNTIIYSVPHFEALASVDITTFMGIEATPHQSMHNVVMVPMTACLVRGDGQPAVLDAVDISIIEMGNTMQVFISCAGVEYDTNLLDTHSHDHCTSHLTTSQTFILTCLHNNLRLYVLDYFLTYSRT